MQDLNTYDKVLKLFVSNDQLRKNMCEPCKRGDFVFSTNAHVIVKIPVALPNGDYTKSHEYYNVEKFFEYTQNIDQEVDFAPVKTWMEGLQMVNLYDDCPDCDGDGLVECECCKSETPCEECGGTGDGKTIIEQIPSLSEGNFEMDGVFFSYSNLKKIIEASEILGEPAKWICKQKNKINIFRIGKIEIGSMPCFV